MCLYNNSINNIYLNSNEELLKYIDKPEKYGTYVLKVFVEDQFGNIEEETIEFSKMIENLTNKKNDFVGLNSFFSNNILQYQILGVLIVLSSTVFKSIFLTSISVLLSSSS